MCATVIDWPTRVSDDEAARRATGRRQYNARRTTAAWERRRIVAYHLLCGARQSDVARLLGVHRSTICRDLAAIKRRWPTWIFGFLPRGACTVTGAQLEAMARHVEAMKAAYWGIPSATTSQKRT
jgi:hypothetical protein